MIDLVVAALLALGLSWSGLLGIPGVESALVLGIVLPIVVAARTAHEVASRRDGNALADGTVLLGRALVRSTAPVLVASAILLVNAYRTKPCEPFRGLLFEAIGPLVGCALAALVGVAIGGLVARPKRAAFAGAMVPTLALGVGLWEFFSTPAIFVFGLFGGYFPGTIYDENVGIPEALLGYRALSLVLATALALVVHATWDGRRIVVSRLGHAPRRTGVAALLLAIYAACTYHGADLGHRSTTRVIEDRLGGRFESERCTFFVPREMPLSTRTLHGDDCDFHVDAVERFLGLHRRSKVRVYVYRSVEEKRALMGAAETDIAKPWRGEVHVEIEPWPHPVLRHELAHVLAAELSGTRAGYATYFGPVPNPGVIEGLAVAAAWDLRDGLTPDEWSRAMLELGILPNVGDLLSLEFARLPANRAYAGAGSFVRFLVEKRGRAALADLYRRGRFTDRAELRTLADEWRAFLHGVSLSREARALARQRFERKSLFTAVCPHVVARLRGELAGDLAAGDTRAAIATCDRILALDPSDRAMLATRIAALAKAGDVEAAERSLAVLAGDPRVPTPTLVNAKMAIADAYLRRNAVDRALVLYDAILDAPQSEDSARQVEARRVAATSPDVERRLLVDLLLGHEGRATPAGVAGALAARLGAVRSDGLGPYLAGRQVVGEGRHDLAAAALDEALARGLPSPRFLREATRLAALSHEAASELDTADALFVQLEDAPFARGEAALHRARIAYRRAHPRRSH